MIHPPEFGITYLDLRASIRSDQTVRIWHKDDYAWRSHSPPDLMSGDVYQAQDTKLYWMWWGGWIGPFNTEEAAVTALRMAV